MALGALRLSKLFPAHAGLAPFLRRADRALYVLWAAFCTLASARSFYGYMLKQTGGEWSAPLDDVFIHLDYARATALGHPFEWTIGNGYSSGNTSLTYPFVLAVGWLLGFVGRDLLRWSAILACICVFGTLLVTRRLFLEGPRDDWGRLSSYLLPPVFLGVGALVWSLWSGMEVAFFLATWAIALVAWQTLEDDAREGRRGRGHAWWLGLSGALLVATRPEAAMTIAIFGIAAAHAHRHRGVRHVLGILVRSGLPAVVVLVVQAIVNFALTGESSANGAIVKLAINNPFMNDADKLADWVFNVKYAALRNLDYHLAHIEGDWMSELVASWPTAPGVVVYLSKTAWWAGVVPLVLAVLPLCFARTRRRALVLSAQVVAWVVLVAFNGQVRWQNERYVMPAVAWVMILAALGVSVALRRRELPSTLEGSVGRRLRPSILATIILGALIVQTIGVLTRPVGMLPVFRLSWLLALACGAGAAFVLRPFAIRAPLVVVLLLFAWDHQAPKMRDQKWFFGRASRNIRDQHLTLGKYLAELKPSRVLVGDAGAILYESDRSGLDIIGLGGYHKLPFARASVQGLPATLELIERIPRADRPDVLAIFPTWWGILPVWFGDDVMRRFPVEGNVICGGYEHVVYKANWHLLNTGDEMRWEPPHDWNGGLAERVRAVLDIADLVSEKQHEYAFDHPENGWTDMRVLPDLADPRRDMFDAGRRIVPGKHESYSVRGLILGKRIHLVVRTAQEASTTVRVRIDGADAGTLSLKRTDGWEETPLLVPAELVHEKIRIELTNEGPGDLVDYHEWITQ